jgi:uncharacterized protein YdhG (YjbR/CyaY superfamily)
MKKDRQVDAYIAGFDAPMRRALSDIRALIWRAAPDAIEVMSHGMPGYVLHSDLVWFAGIGSDVALYPRGHHFKKAYAAQIKGYKTIQGAVLFPASVALPDALISQIVRDRVEENKRTSTPTPAGTPEKLGAPAKRALANAQITSLDALARYSEAEILALHGIGPGSIPALRAALAAAGLAFRGEG